jgi:hypothetical protein
VLPARNVAVPRVADKRESERDEVLRQSAAPSGLSLSLTLMKTQPFSGSFCPAPASPC